MCHPAVLRENWYKNKVSNCRLIFAFKYAFDYSIEILIKSKKQTRIEAFKLPLPQVTEKDGSYGKSVNR